MYIIQYTYNRTGSAEQVIYLEKMAKISPFSSKSNAYHRTTSTHPPNINFQVQGDEYPTVETFMTKYRLDAPAALGNADFQPLKE